MKFIIAAIVLVISASTAMADASHTRVYESTSTGKLYECTQGQRALSIGTMMSGAILGALVGSKLPGGQYAVVQMSASLGGAFAGSELGFIAACTRLSKEYWLSPDRRLSDLWSSK
jgi:hypothetical protein